MYINAAEYLEEIRATRVSINNMNRELKAYDIILEASGISYDNTNISVSPRQDGLERKAMAHLEKCAELRAEITEKIEWMHKRIDEAVSYINRIDSEEQKEVLMFRYIEHMSWSEILDIRGCDELSSQYKLHKRAIMSLQHVLEGEGSI